MRNLGIVKDSSKLRQMILDDPDLPIVVLVGESAWDGYHSWTYCSNVRVEIDETLDADILDYNDCVFYDREELENYLCNELETEPNNIKISDEEFNKRLQEEVRKYDPYWKKVICIYADN